MKKLVAVLLIVASTCVSANDNRSWVTPMLIGGAIGYVYSQNQNKPVQVIQQPVIIYQSPLLANPPMQPVYQEVLIYNQDCACYQKQYRQIGWQQ